MKREAHYCLELRSSSRPHETVCGRRGLVLSYDGKWYCEKHIPPFADLEVDLRVGTTTQLTNSVFSRLSEGISYSAIYSSLSENERFYMTHVLKTHISFLEGL